MDISKMTVEQLKALAFDFIKQRDIAAQNLTVVLQELDKREKEVKNDDTIGHPANNGG
jgi:hypothetical protein